jgi:hypothetical protein
LHYACQQSGNDSADNCQIEIIPDSNMYQ